MKRLKLTTEYCRPYLFVMGLLFMVSAMLGSGCSTEIDTKEIPAGISSLFN